MRSNPREAKSLKASSKSAGDLVCTRAVSAPSLLLISCKPLNAAAFQPASLTDPGVSSATRNPDCVELVVRCELHAASSPTSTKPMPRNFKAGKEILLCCICGPSRDTRLLKGDLALTALIALAARGTPA